MKKIFKIIYFLFIFCTFLKKQCEFMHVAESSKINTSYYNLISYSLIFLLKIMTVILAFNIKVNILSIFGLGF